MLASSFEYNITVHLVHVLIVRFVLSHEVPVLIAPLSDIQMFYIKYLTMHKVHSHACWCNKAFIVWLCV